MEPNFEKVVKQVGTAANYHTKTYSTWWKLPLPSSVEVADTDGRWVHQIGIDESSAEAECSGGGCVGKRTL